MKWYESLIICLAFTGRCTVMSDLRVITFDGNNVALYDNGSYILVNLPRETIIGTVEKCPTSQVLYKVNAIKSNVLKSRC